MDCSVLLLLGIYTAEARVLLQYNELPTIRQSHLHCSLIYLGSFPQLFLHSDQLLRVK